MTKPTLNAELVRDLRAGLRYRDNDQVDGIYAEDLMERAADEIDRLTQGDQDDPVEQRISAANRALAQAAGLPMGRITDQVYVAVAQVHATLAVAEATRRPPR